MSTITPTPNNGNGIRLRFHRTDSNDSLASSLASGFFGSFLSRNNSRAKGMGLMQRGGSGLLPSHLAREAAQAAAMQRYAEYRPNMNLKDNLNLKNCFLIKNVISTSEPPN